MATLKARLAARDALLAALREADYHPDMRWDPVHSPVGNVPAFVVFKAEKMLAIVNELRTEKGLSAATLEQVLQVERSASGHSDYPDKYALRCAFLALGEED